MKSWKQLLSLFSVVVVAYLLVAGMALAQGNVPWEIDQQIQNIDESIRGIHRDARLLNGNQKRAVLRRLENTERLLTLLQASLSGGSGGGGGGGQRQGWVASNREDCYQVCERAGLRLDESPEGAQCASGEVRPNSALAAGVRFPYGTWGDGSLSVYGATAYGEFCYAPGSRRDNDRTDLTVACYCSRGIGRPIR